MLVLGRCCMFFLGVLGIITIIGSSGDKAACLTECDAVRRDACLECVVTATADYCRDIGVELCHEWEAECDTHPFSDCCNDTEINDCIDTADSDHGTCTASCV